VTACYPVDSPLLDLQYPLEGSPCRQASLSGRCFIAREVVGAFPDDDMLRDGNLEAYAGQRLLAAEGGMVGLLVLLFEQPITDEARVQNVLEVFAPRAARELERERTHAVIRASELRLNMAIEGSGQGIWEWSPDSDCVEIAGAQFEHFQSLSGAQLFSRIHAEDRALQHRALRDYYSGAVPYYEFQGRVQQADGDYQWMLVRGKGEFRDEHGRFTKLIGTITDISPLKTIQAELERSQQFLELVIETVPQSIFWQDRDGRYQGGNQHFADLADVACPADLVGLKDRDMPWRGDAQRLLREDKPLLDGIRAHFHREVEVAPGDAPAQWFDLVKVPMRDADGDVIGVLGTVNDITVRKQAEQAAKHLAYFDALTELPNRRYFNQRLEASFAAARRRGNFGALLFIDMDQFKQVNDTLGHSVGDQLLKAVADRLRNVTRQEDTVARIGGDEFVVLLPEIAPDLDVCAHQSQLVAEKIHQSLGQPFQFDHHQFHVTPTIGISLFPENGRSADDVLKQADTAMYSGKAAGRNVTRFFRREMEESTRQRLMVEGDLRQAIARQAFELYFQPQVDHWGAVSGAEVLLRWNHPQRGQVLPSEFIPIAEERGLIIEIGHWVLNAAFERYREWLGRGIVLDELAINVSSKQLRSDTFVDEVEQLLGDYRIPADRIMFEITEGTVIEDVEATIEIMLQLGQLGIRFSIDDFGVGYSSLSYLKRLPIDQLKIDRSFVADIGTDQSDEVICQTIAAMSRQLQLHTVAEGVESQEQFDFLSGIGINAYQGYLFLRPSREDVFLDFLNSKHRRE